MLKRKLYIIGEISDAAYTKFSKQLYNRELESTKPIEIELMSEGGDPIAALAFAGRIKTSKCDIHITAFGQVASAAVMILASGDYRQMQRNCWMMVHQGGASLEADDDGVRQVENYAKQLRKLEDQWSDLLATYTGTDSEVWENLHLEKTYLTAEECLILKIVDKLI